ncbi:MAG: DNA mismatch repair endonuclease MutL [Clostridia bacterium]|nr:DNA mismatch repair endonuclease MutL [Clostridia bacterium]
MGSIVLLDELTVNKIAAGEVIERPASVIKEMVENSIDAGATNINIEIKNGGISYIRITDNGKGISTDDLEIAFERHATSKIRSAEDLNEVKSMGFRGEALASIAAIANVEMISKTKEQEIGNRIVVEAGQVLSMEETGCQQGTTITVQNLFFNTPVRYKFLKKDYTESGYIEDAITRLALINPNIAFKLVNSGKTIIQTSGNGNIQDVIYSIYGKDIATSVLDVNYEYEEMRVTGVVGKPEIARSNRSNQLFFVNKRYVKDKTLSSAVESAFKGLLPIGKYGFLVLNIEMNPAKVDVNVHPAKLEVRFQEEGKVFKAIYHAIKDTLLKAELVANTEKTVEQIEKEEVQPNVQKSSFSDLFRKISRAQEHEEKQDNAQDNILEQIYKQKENTAPVQTIEKTTEVISDTIKSDMESKRKDVFKELLAMQERLKEETKDNPNIRTNIDTLIQNTKQLEETETDVKDEEPVEEQESVVTDNIEENEIQEEKEDKADEVKEDETNYNVVETDKEDATKEESNEQNQDTKVFSSEEIQEMMDTLEKIDNIEESPEFANMYEKIFGKLPASVEENKKQQEEKINAYELIKDNNISVFENIEEYKKPVYKLVGIAFNTYIIIEIQNELYIIDQHAAHERVMYEKVKENYYSDENKDSQMLLLPDVITLTHKEMDILRDNYDMFEKAGFILEEFGENTIKLSGVPNICLELDTKELFLETLDEINQVARTAKQEIEERFIATVACKAAVKAHMDLTHEEVDSLMSDLLKLPNPFTCPHGRPTAIKMDKNDIEKKFARRK